MTVVVNSVGEGIEISWDPTGAPEEPPAEEKPPGFPTHPIFLPPYVDNTLPPHVDHELPGDQPEVSPPIYLPPYIDNSLPGEGTGIWGPNDPRPTPPIEIPPDIGLDEEQKEKLKAFLEGNLPPFNPPDYVGPVDHDQNIACQVFAQGQDGDWSNTGVQPNDGLSLLRYPKGFKGDSYAEIRALDGSLIDSGSFTVGK